MLCRCSNLHQLLVVLLFVVSASADHLSRVPDVDPDDANTLTAATRHLLRWARVEAVKRGILQQLGLTEAPRPPPRSNNTSGDASAADDDVIDRHVMTAYRRSLVETAAARGKNHVTGNDVIEDDDVDAEFGVPQAKQFYSFKGHVHPATECNELSSERLLLFRVEIPEPKEPHYETVVTSATLRLHTRPPPAATGTNTQQNSIVFYRVNVYHVISNGDATVRRRHDDVMNATEIRHLVTSRTIRTFSEEEGVSADRWEEFDVSSAVEKQLTSHGGKAGVLQLEVKVTVSAGQGEDGQETVTSRGGLEFGEWCNMEEPEPTHKHRPQLNILARDRPVRHQHSRSRRSVTAEPVEPLCTPGDGESRCCRRALWISFHEIGWDDWILAPDGYQAYYCEGSCPPGHLTAHNYAAIRQLLLVAGLGGAGGRGAPPLPLPTCSATRLSPLPIAHYLNGRRVVSIFDDMIVDECRCA